MRGIFMFSISKFNAVWEGIWCESIMQRNEATFVSFFIFAFMYYSSLYGHEKARDDVFLKRIVTIWLSQFNIAYACKRPLGYIAFWVYLTTNNFSIFQTSCCVILSRIWPCCWNARENAWKRRTHNLLYPHLP